jgi:hypothetical protein
MVQVAADCLGSMTLACPGHDSWVMISGIPRVFAWAGFMAGDSPESLQRSETRVCLHVKYPLFKYG